MPFLQTKKFPSFTGIAAGSNASVEIPSAGTIYELWLRPLSAASVALTVAQMKAEIDNIVMRIDGDQIIDLSPTYLLMLQQYYGGHKNANNIAGVLPLIFQRRNLVDPLARSVFALGTADIRSITIEAKLNATMPTLNKIDVFARISNENDRILGQHVRLHKFPYTFASTGLYEVSTLPKDPRTGILSTHIQIPGTSTITDVTTTIGTNDILASAPPDIQQAIMELSKRDPQTGFYHIDYDTMDDLEGFLPMIGVQDYRQKITWATAAPGTFDIIQERIFNLAVR